VWSVSQSTESDYPEAEEIMILTPTTAYLNDPFETESQLESAIAEVSALLFGPDRIYLDVKKLVGAKGKTKNIPDGYLIDLASKKDPRLFMVENELATHDPLNHVAVQILEFSLSFEKQMEANGVTHHRAVKRPKLKEVSKDNEID